LNKLVKQSVVFSNFIEFAHVLHPINGAKHGDVHRIQQTFIVSTVVHPLQQLHVHVGFMMMQQTSSLFIVIISIIIEI